MLSKMSRNSLISSADRTPITLFLVGVVEQLFDFHQFGWVSVNH